MSVANKNVFSSIKVVLHMASPMLKNNTFGVDRPRPTRSGSVGEAVEGLVTSWN